MLDIESWLSSEEPTLLRQAISMAPDPDTARDWVAEARLKVLSVARVYPDKASGYYARVAKNKLISMQRASRRRYRDAIIFSQCPTSSSVVDSVVSPDDHEASLVRLAVTALRRSAKAAHGAAASRAVAMLAEGQTWPEVAAALGLTVERVSVMKESLRGVARDYYNVN
jgi:DNA-directed RNA polymerase specialized sigma24 family protein